MPTAESNTGRPTTLWLWREPRSRYLAPTFFFLSATDQLSTTNLETSVVDNATMSTKLFAEIDAAHADKLDSMTMHERAVRGLPYIANDADLARKRIAVRRL